MRLYCEVNTKVWYIVLEVFLYREWPIMFVILFKKKKVINQYKLNSEFLSIIWEIQPHIRTAIHTRVLGTLIKNPLDFPPPTDSSSNRLTCVHWWHHVGFHWLGGVFDSQPHRLLLSCVPFIWHSQGDKIKGRLPNFLSPSLSEFEQTSVLPFYQKFPKAGMKGECF